MSLPKVLIIGQPFNKVTGGGITLTNLFKDWDKDKIAVACSGYLLTNVTDLSICNTYYQLGSKEHHFVFPFYLFKHKYHSGLKKFNEKKTDDVKIHKSKFRLKMIMDYFYPFLKYIGLFHCISKTELSNDFCNWLDHYEPDIIYAQATTREAVLFINSVHSYLKKPMIFHMMDDWPTLDGNKGLLKNYWNKKIDNEFRLLLDKATLLLGISDLMSQEYKKRYGKEFLVFHNPIDIEFWEKSQRFDYELGDNPTILYAGRTGLGINSSLEVIAKAVHFLNEEHNIPLKFILQTSENPSWTNNYSCVEHNSLVPYNELPKVFSEADFLILPYDFSKESINFVQYSMPTKASEYMISGSPIIIFAPEVTAIVKYAKEYKWAKIVTSQNINDLSVALLHLIKNKEERQSIGKAAKKIAQDRHNSIKVKNEFKTLICTLQTK